MSTYIPWVVNPDGTPGEVWNPVVGCTPAGEGCLNCWARSLHNRRHQAYLRGAKLPEQYAYPFEQVQLLPDRLTQPSKWRKPRMIFVCSCSDLFHKQVPDGFILRVYEQILRAPWHTFVILTKRPERTQEWLQYYGAIGKPLPNLWLGVSCSTQAEVDRMVPILLDTPAALRFVSLEPLIEAVDVSRWLYPMEHCPSYDGGCRRPENPAGCADESKPADPASCAKGWCIYPYKTLDWVIAGSESINGRPGRAALPSWFYDLRDQCVRARLPYFCKQIEHDGKLLHMPRLYGQVWDQMPERGAR